MFDGIIFDLDGTLWDVTEVSVRVMTNLAERHPEAGTPAGREEIASCMGLLLDEIARRLFPTLTPAHQMELMEEFAKGLRDTLAVEGGILYPELEPVLKALASRYPLFIVSNCEEGYIQAFFQAHGLGGYFRDIEYPGRTGLPKADNIRMIVERNGLQSPVYVGDTAGDAASAKKAGVPFIFARYGFGQIDDCLFAVDSLPELSAKLTRPAACL